MKKLLVLVAIITTAALSANAQQGNFDPAAMKARYMERTKPLLIEKTKLTEAEADKVLEINWESRSKLRGTMRDLSPEERQKKMEEVQADADKQYKTIPLTDEQIKAVDDFFTEQRKQMQQNRGNRGGN